MLLKFPRLGIDTKSLPHTGELDAVTTTVPSIGEDVQQLLQFDCKGARDTKDIWPSGWYHTVYTLFQEVINLAVKP